MHVLGIQYCSISPESEALAKFLDALSMSRRSFLEFASKGPIFDGAIFPGPGGLQMSFQSAVGEPPK